MLPLHLLRLVNGSFGGRILDILFILFQSRQVLVAGVSIWGVYKVGEPGFGNQILAVVGRLLLHLAPVVRCADVVIQRLELIVLLSILCLETVNSAVLEVALEQVSLHIEHAHSGLKSCYTLSLIAVGQVFRFP